MLIHVQQPTTYMSSNILVQQKSDPCLQCSYMSSNIHVQRTNESARRYDTTVLRTQAHGIESRFVVRLCAKTHFRSHTWHTCPAKFKPNRTSICWTCMLLDKYVAGLYEHCKRCCWTSMLLDMYEHCNRGFKVTTFDTLCRTQLQKYTHVM